MRQNGKSLSRARVGFSGWISLIEQLGWLTMHCC